MCNELWCLLPFTGSLARIGPCYSTGTHECKRSTNPRHYILRNDRQEYKGNSIPISLSHTKISSVTSQGACHNFPSKKSRVWPLLEPTPRSISRRVQTPKQGIFASLAVMEVVRRAMKRLPTATDLPTMKEAGNKNKTSSRWAFFGRPLRLKGNSAVSVPLGVVLLFPFTVVICILVLFVRHPSSPGRGLLMSAGGPPTIRYGL